MFWLRFPIVIEIFFSARYDGNITESVLRFIPSAQDQGRLLSCRGETPGLLEGNVEDVVKLEVQCKLLEMFPETLGCFTSIISNILSVKILKNHFSFFFFIANIKHFECLKDISFHDDNSKLTISSFFFLCS